MWYASQDINSLIGKTFTSVKNTGDAIYFKNDTEEYSLHHEQDCCESVYIDDVVGDLSNLEGTPITFASEENECGSPKRTTYGNNDEHSYEDESSTWSFYKLGTVKGWVDIKFYGSSNGYYSESAHLYKVK